MDNYFTSIEQFFKFAKIFGLFPMSFVKPVWKGKLKFTKLSIIRTIATLVFLFAMNCMIIHNHITYQLENQPFLSFMVWSWFLILVYPIIIIQLILQVVNMKRIRKFHQSINNIDLKCRKLFIKFEHKKYRKIVLYTTVFVISNMVLRFVVSTAYALFNNHFQLTEGNMVIQEICYVCFLFYECFFTLQFIFPTYLIRERFTGLKNLLK